MIKSHQNKKHLVCQRLRDAFQIHQDMQAFPLISATEAFFLLKSLSWMQGDALTRNCCCVIDSSLKCDSIFTIQGSLLAQGSAGGSCAHIWMLSSFWRKGKIPFLIIFQLAGVGRGQGCLVLILIHQLHKLLVRFSFSKDAHTLPGEMWVNYNFWNRSALLPL